MTRSLLLALSWTTGMLAVQDAGLRVSTPPARAQEHLKPRSSRVEWELPSPWPSNAELEVGSASFHGGSLRWLRFRPRADRVEVLSLRLSPTSLARNGPSRAAIEVATLDLAEYRALLDDLAWIAAARIVEIPAEPGVASRWATTGDFWAQARVGIGSSVLHEDEWAGQPGDAGEPRYARVSAGARLAVGEVADRLSWSPVERDDSLSDWVARKHERDTRAFPQDSAHKWVRERYQGLFDLLGGKHVEKALAEEKLVRVRVLDEKGGAILGAEASFRSGSRTIPAIPRTENAGGSQSRRLLEARVPGGEWELSVKASGFRDRDVRVRIPSPEEIVVRLRRDPGPQ